jgi:hypothetical protein
VRLALALVAVAAGCVALLAPSPAPDRAPAARQSTAVAAVAAAAVSPASPTSVHVPTAGIGSDLVPLGLDSSGALVPPTDYARAGWYAAGTRPGAVGPAVIAGHVDSRDGPAVFFRLGDVTVGDPVVVGRADGSTVRFTVTRVARYAKSQFPTALVYGPTPDAELRLITCGGAFDRSAGSYLDDVVVFAHLA